MWGTRTARQLRDTLEGVERAASAITISSREDVIPVRDAALSALSEVETAARSVSIAAAVVAVAVAIGLVVLTISVVESIE